MATISSPGLGSGLDINGIITKLMAVESQPLSVLATREVSYQAKISAYGTLKSALSSLQTAAETLADTSTYTGKSSSSSDTSVLTTSVSGSPGQGSYNVVVSQLAASHSLRSTGSYTATTNTFTTGTLTIKVGSGSAVNITIDSSNNTLAGVRDAINSANAGVTASIVNDGTYQRLFLTSGTTGTDGTITTTVTDSASGGTFALADLASNDSTRSTGNYTSTSDTFNSGTLSIAVGGGATVDITINASNNTLSGIRDAINGNTSVGVTASIVSDGSYQRLVLTSKTAGSSGEISVTNTEDGVTMGSFGLSGLNATATAGTYLNTSQAATNAELTVNSLAITSSSNTITTAIEGVTLNLIKDGSSTVKVATNTAATVSAFDAFVKAYNDASKQISNVSGYNSETKQGAILTGDSTVRNIQSRLRQLLFSGVSSLTRGVQTLSDLGIRLQKDGTLSLDTGKLTSALNDPVKDVKGLMTQTTSGNPGIAVRFAEGLASMVDSDGLIDNRTEGINASIKSLQKQNETLQKRLADIEKRYRAQFTALDSLVASLNQTSQYLSQQLANLPKISSS